MLLTTSDWMRETWTPISRWTPEHSMHTMTPKLVDNHVASVVIEEYINIKHRLSKQLDGTFKYGLFWFEGCSFFIPPLSNMENGRPKQSPPDGGGRSRVE